MSGWHNNSLMARTGAMSQPMCSQNCFVSKNGTKCFCLCFCVWQLEIYFILLSWLIYTGSWNPSVCCRLVALFVAHTIEKYQQWRQSISSIQAVLWGACNFSVSCIVDQVLQIFLSHYYWDLFVVQINRWLLLTNVIYFMSSKANVSLRKNVMFKFNRILGTCSWLFS